VTENNRPCVKRYGQLVPIFCKGYDTHRNLEYFEYWQNSGASLKTIAAPDKANKANIQGVLKTYKDGKTASPGKHEFREERLQYWQEVHKIHVPAYLSNTVQELVGMLSKVGRKNGNFSDMDYTNYTDRFMCSKFHEKVKANPEAMIRC
jgi:hypothetical protein